MDMKNLGSEILLILEENKSLINGMDNDVNRRKLLSSLFEPLLRDFSQVTVLNASSFIGEYLFQTRGDLAGVINSLSQRVRSDNMWMEADSKEGFDLKYGTSTSIIKEQLDLGELITPERALNFHRYIPTLASTMRYILKRINIDYRSSTFIDIGSGLGRNLLIASEFPFRSIVGIEVAETLHNIALSNVRIYQSKLKQYRQIELYCMDILQFKFPKDTNLILYFWYPFSEQVFKRFLDKFLESFDLVARTIIFIFLDRHYDLIESITEIPYSTQISVLDAESRVTFFSNKEIHLKMVN